MRHLASLMKFRSTMYLHLSSAKFVTMQNFPITTEAPIVSDRDCSIYFLYDIELIILYENLSGWTYVFF